MRFPPFLVTIIRISGYIEKEASAFGHQRKGWLLFYSAALTAILNRATSTTVSFLHIWQKSGYRARVVSLYTLVRVRFPQTGHGSHLYSFPILSTAITTLPIITALRPASGFCDHIVSSIFPIMLYVHAFVFHVSFCAICPAQKYCFKSSFVLTGL